MLPRINMWSAGIIPTGMAIDKDGNIYSACTGYSGSGYAINKYTKEGVYLKTLPNIGSDTRYTDITIDSDGMIYAVSYNYDLVGWVTVWNSDDTINRIFDLISTSPAFPTFFSRVHVPTSIALDNNENLVILDSYMNSCSVFTRDGVCLGRFGGFAYNTELTSFRGLNSGVVVDSNNYIYILDAGNCQVRKFTSPVGWVIPTCVAYWGDNGWTYEDYPMDDHTYWVGGSGAGQLHLGAAGIGIDKDNNIYIADTYNNRMQKFSSSGSLLEVFQDDLTPSWGRIKIDGNNFYVSGNNSGSHYIARYGIEDIPIVDAGPDQINVRTPITTIFQLNGTVENSTNYTWSSIDNVIITDEHSLTTTVEVPDIAAVTLRLTAINTADTIYDDVILYTDNYWSDVVYPVVFAGPNQYKAKIPDINTSFTMAGVVRNSSDFNWSVLSTDTVVNIVNPLSLTTNIILNGTGTVILQLTARNYYGSRSAIVTLSDVTGPTMPIVEAGPPDSQIKVSPSNLFTISESSVSNATIWGWEIISGNARIEHPELLHPVVECFDVGTVTIRLTASNNGNIRYDSTTLTVVEWPDIPDWPTNPSFPIETGGGITKLALDVHYGKKHLKQGFK